MTDYGAKLTKILVSLGINNVTAQSVSAKYLGLLSITQSENLGGWLNPNVIGGYSFNPADGRWYQPSIFDGSFDWDNPADPSTQSALEEKQSARELHNKVEGLGPASGDAGSYDAPTIGQLADWIPEFARYLWDSAKAGEMLPADRFDAAQRSQPARRDPLTLDLDGDGLETIGTSSTNPILFDHDGDGVKNGTGWVKPDDGFLVLDRNGNGTIDNGAELFGDSTPLYAGGFAADGFAALAQEDTNQDGVVNAQDANWNNLKVWRDLNQDGVSQANELFTLEQLGITSFNVAKTANSQVLANGNQIADLGTFTRSDGSSSTMGDVSQMADINLAVDTFHRTFTDTIPLAEGVAALPGMQGSGMVRDLREAASLSTDLQSILTQYSQATTRQEQRALLDGLLDAWADTSGMEERIQDRYDSSFVSFSYESFGSETLIVSNPYGGQMWNPDWGNILESWEQKLHILEAFNGRYFFTLPDVTQIGGSAVSGMAAGGGGGGGGSDTAVSGRTDFIINLSQDQVNLLNQSYDALRESVYSALVMQTRFKSLLDKIDLIIDENGIRLGFEELQQHFQEKITQNSANGIADLFDFNRASKNILESSGWNGAALMTHYMASLALTPEILSFYKEVGFSVVGQADFIGNGAARDEIILSGDANAVIYGNGGNDVIVGRFGDDVLYGGSGNDTLVGGAGNDILYGGDSSAGTGNDTYRFSRGDGVDSIVDNDSTAGNVDTIEFTDVASNELRSIERNGYSLVIKYGETDQITVVNHFVGSGAYRIEQIKFSDGVVLSGISLGTVNADNLTGTIGNDWIDGSSGGDILIGKAGNDIYVIDHINDVVIENANEGIDTVHSSITYTLANNVEALQLTGNNAIDGMGNTLDNLLIGNNANNTLDGGVGNDILQGGAGADILTDLNGNGLLDGGSGEDVLTGGTGRELFIGGLGNDNITTGAGADIIVFNKGDGQDIVNAGVGMDNTLSLGKGVQYADLLFTKNASDLILAIGATDQITLKDWYLSNDNRSVANLQMVIEGSADYDPASAIGINSMKIVQFDFDGLVSAFDQARTASPTLTSWALSSSLLEFHLGGSDTAAIGGDLAYQYATNGNLSTLSMTSAQSILDSGQFGIASQTLQPISQLQDSSPRLI